VIKFTLKITKVVATLGKIIKFKHLLEFSLRLNKNELHQKLKKPKNAVAAPKQSQLPKAPSKVNFQTNSQNSRKIFEAGNLEDHKRFDTSMPRYYNWVCACI
jgi:hypothetical protein